MHSVFKLLQAATATNNFVHPSIVMPGLALNVRSCKPAIEQYTRNNANISRGRSRGTIVERGPETF